MKWLWLVVSYLFGLGYAFNLDIPSSITHRGPSGSMFGFSIAQHKDSNISWILVGAPTAETNQPGVRKPGAVFRCSCESRNTCQIVPFDRLGNNQVEGRQIDEKSGQWFGATVKSSGDDGIVLSCAPRYTWFSTNRKRRDPVGTCFVAKDSFTEYVEYSPCRTSKWGYHRQGSCQLGLGADIDSDGRRLFLGAVGSWYWQGQVFLVDHRRSSPQNRVAFYQFIQPGQLHSQSITAKPDIRWTREGPNFDDDSYLGYSVAHGKFSDGEDSDVAVGMPRGANLTGKVVIYSGDLTSLHNITGDQIGAYFGYSLCVADVDGDGLHDIIIGSPMYTDFTDSAMKIETGRVYVVYQTKRHKFRKWDAVDGTANRGRFGLSLTSIGDINKDGFNDFAVGAPYAGVNGRGCVYLYLGSAAGVQQEFSQVIYAEDLHERVSTFGFSLSGGRDLDGNSYNDLVVGAYDSDFVALFKAKPVVRLNSKLSFTTASKQINLEEKTCRLRDSTPVSCLGLKLCMEYDGIGVEDSIEFNVQYILDSKKPKDPRMFFVNYERRNVLNQTIQLYKNRAACNNLQVYLKPQITDKLTLLDAELRYSMIEISGEQRRRSRQLPAVIDLNSSKPQKDSIAIQKNCGPDNTCIPDLRVSISQSHKSFLMGSTEKIWIEVEVYNNREDSFESSLYMSVPPSLSYVNMLPMDQEARKDVAILCSPPSPSSNYTLKCDIGNPLPAFAKVKFRLIFQPRYGSEAKSSFDFFIEVNSTNPEDDLTRGDNIKLIHFPVRVQTDVDILGVSLPSPVRHNRTIYTGEEKVNEADAGPEVIHIYEIKCDGPSDIEEAEVTIIWPSYMIDGSQFLYLLEQPMIEGPATCEEVFDVNPLGLHVQQQTKKFLKYRHGYLSGGTLSSSSSVGLGTEETLIGKGRGESSSSSSQTEKKFSSSTVTGEGSYSHSFTNYTRSSSRSSQTFSSNSNSNQVGVGTVGSRSSVGNPYDNRGNVIIPPPNSQNSDEDDFRHPDGGYRRAKYKRDTEDSEDRKLLESDLNCGPTKCIRINCKIHSFEKGKTVVFILRGRIWSDTLNSKFSGQNVNISSRLITRISKLPYNVDPKYLKHKKREIFTLVEEDADLTEPRAIPWWVYLLAVLGGILFLLLIIYLLYKVGFFKRRRPRAGPEGQPLNRNGYHPGDERL